MIQILALRDYLNKQSGKMEKAEVWFEKGMRAPTVEAILETPEKFLQVLEPSERVNIYFTVADTLEERGRKLAGLYHIPFDIDKLVLPGDPTDGELETLARVAIEALGLKYEETGVLFSGNGIQFFVGMTKAIEDPAEFADLRPYYKAACGRINAALKKAGFAGEADPAVWSPARLMRMPQTWNEKPNKPRRMARVIQAKIERIETDIKKLSGIPEISLADQIPRTVADTMPLPDVKTILGTGGCGFLAWNVAKPEEVSEPQWYAALSITSRFPNGRAFSHEMSKGHPGYDYHQADLKIDQALIASGPRTCESISQLWDGCKDCIHFKKGKASPITLEGPDHIKTQHTGFHHMIYDGDKTKKGKPDFDGLTKYFMSLYPYKSVARAIWAFEGSHYRMMKDTELEFFANAHFNPKLNRQGRKEFIDWAMYHNGEEPNWFQKTTEGKINFQNVVLDIRSGEQLPKSPAYGFTATIPFDYDPLAKCPRWEKFMGEVMLGRQELIDVIQEFCGYALAGMNPRTHEKAIVFSGEGSNGKSTLVDVLRSIFTEQGASNISVRGMTNNQNMVNIEGKLANIAEENSDDSFKDAELLKNFISGGMVLMKRLYAQPYEVANRAKLFMLCNKLPRTIDTTYGMMRKLMIVPFDAKFTVANKNINLGAELKAELPGIVNWIIEGYKRLEKQGKFTHSPIIENASTRYFHTHDSVAAWFEEEVEISPSDEAIANRQELYNSYKSFCEDNGIRFVQTSRTVYDFLRKKAEEANGRPPLEKNHRENGTVVRVFTNIILSTPHRA